MDPGSYKIHVQDQNSETQPFRLALVLVHNHRHEANLARLDDFLGARFKNIQHLVPFYRGSAKNVISIYDSSHRFQNFFAQGRARFDKADCTHYLFCGDDLIINPRLDETNLGAELGLDNRSGFIKYLEPITRSPFAWPHVAGALSALASNSGTNWKNELPEAAVANQRLNRHGLQVGQLSLRQLGKGIRPKQIVQLVNYIGMRWLKGARSWKAMAQPPYPLIGGYADFIVVPAVALAEFCHYCGIFAAANVFAELAAPTALALSCERIVCEKDSKWKGVELWGKDIDAFGQSRSYSLAALMERFGPEQLYLHPVKLSKWK